MKHQEVIGGRITVALTGSAAARAALRWAIVEASRTDARLAVVHVFDPIERADLTLERNLTEAEHGAAQLAQMRTIDELANLDADLDVAIFTPRGPLEQTLVDLARGSDVVVFGRAQSDTHQGLPRTLADSCDCCVVVVSEDGEVVRYDRSPLSGVPRTTPRCSESFQMRCRSATPPHEKRRRRRWMS